MGYFTPEQIQQVASDAVRSEEGRKFVDYLSSDPEITPEDLDQIQSAIKNEGTVYEAAQQRGVENLPKRGIIGDIGAGLSRGIDVAQESAAALFESKVPFDDSETRIGRFISKQRKEREAILPSETQALKPGGFQDVVAQGMESVPLSLGISAPAFVAGTALSANPIVGAAAAGVASGAAMYKPAVQQFLREVRDEIKRQYDMTPEQWDYLQGEVLGQARKSGLAEAGGEALSNALEFMIFKVPIGKLGKPIGALIGAETAKKVVGSTIAKVTGKTAGTVGAEILGEGVTQEANTAALAETPYMGELTKGYDPNASYPERLAKATGEIAGPTAAASIFQAGGLGIASRFAQRGIQTPAKKPDVDKPIDILNPVPAETEQPAQGAPQIPYYPQGLQPLALPPGQGFETLNAPRGLEVVPSTAIQMPYEDIPDAEIIQDEPESRAARTGIEPIGPPPPMAPAERPPVPPAGGISGLLPAPETSLREQGGETVAKTVNSELPGNSIKFDGIQEGIDDIPESYQFTAYEGPAKGATFTTPDLKPETVKAMLNQMIELRKPKAEPETITPEAIPEQGATEKAPEIKPKVKEPWEIGKDEYYSLKYKDDPASANRFIEPDYDNIEKSTGIKFKIGSDHTVRPVIRGGKEPSAKFTAAEETALMDAFKNEGYQIDRQYRKKVGSGTKQRNEITDIEKGNGFRLVSGSRPTNPEHYRTVKQALSEGKPVPPEVLKDYPDLKAAEGKDAEAKKQSMIKQVDDFFATDITPAQKKAYIEKIDSLIEQAKNEGQPDSFIAELEAKKAKITPPKVSTEGAGLPNKRHSVAKDVLDSLEFLRTNGKMRDSNIAEGMRSGVMEPDRKSRNAISNVNDAIDTGEIKPEQIPDDVVDWFYNSEHSRERANKKRLDAMFTPEGERKRQAVPPKVKREATPAQETPRAGAAPAKPEAPKATEPVKPDTEEIGKPGSSDKLASWIVKKLEAGKVITWQMLFNEADKAFVGTQAQGAYSVKDAYDAMELGVNRYLLSSFSWIEPSGKRYSPKQNVERLKDILEQLPTQTKRTQEQQEFQQFSTPPSLAYVANWVVNIGKNDVYLEPSAGIGGLAIFGRMSDAKEIIVNELSPRRLELLKFLGFNRYFNENAEQLNNILPEDVKPSVIVMNPPFSATAGRVEKNLTKYGAQHIEQALARLQEGGRLVAIVGRGMADDRPTFKKWWVKIKSKYNVKANISISGEDYKKYGTTFDNQILVIDKTGKTDYDILTGYAEKIEDLIPILEEVRNERGKTSKQPSDQPTRIGAPEEAQPSSGQRQPVRRPAVEVGFGEQETGSAGGRGGMAAPAVRPGTEEGGGVSGPEESQTAKRPGVDRTATGRGSERPSPGDRTRGSVDDVINSLLDLSAQEAERLSQEQTPAPLPKTPKVRKDSVKAAKDQAKSKFEEGKAEVAAAIKKFNDLLGEKGEITDDQIDPAKWPALREALQQMWDGVKKMAEGIQEAAQIFIKEAYGKLSSKGKPYIDRFIKEDIRADLEAERLSNEQDSIPGELEYTDQGSHKAETQQEIEDSLFSGYRPKVAVPGAKPHPAKLVQSVAMADTELPDAKYHPRLPEPAIKSGKISDAQIEAVVYANQSFEKIMPDGRRRGFFIGDGTGVGKGREISAIIWENWLRGKKKAVWISEKPGLMKDAERDIKGVGWQEGAENLFTFPKKKNRAERAKPIIRGKGILFTSYATLRKDSKDVRSEEPETLKNLDIKLNQLVKWLGKDFDGVIAFDESHNMRNAAPSRGDRGVKPPSQQALSGMLLTKLLPKARVVYVSATGAVEIENLVYADRLGLWGEGTPFSNSQKFLGSLQRSGIAGMEMIARDLKSRGLYISRSLSYDDVEYDRMVHTLDDRQTSAYNELARAWQVVLQNINAAVDATGGAKSSMWSQFWGAQQRFFNSVVTAMQMPSVLESSRRDIEAGHSVIFQLTTTGNAQLERKTMGMEEGEELEDLDLTPKEGLMNFLEASFPTQQYEEYTDENGNRRKRPVVDSQGKPVQNAEAVEMRNDMLQRIGSIKDIPTSPLDLIIHAFGSDKVAEVTARGKRLVYDADGKLKLEPWSKAKGEADAARFMGGDKRILVFSEAGGTGASYHADIDSQNQEKRIHYLLQSGWNAVRAVQGLGRSHRSNQRQAPKFWLVTTDIKGQMRFISTIARRLDQLGALTKGQRQAGSQGIFQARDNLENEYAKEALISFFRDVQHDAIEGMGLADFQTKTGLKLETDDGLVGVEDMPTVKQFLNRILVLEISDQNLVFDNFSERIDRVIQRHAEAGTLDVGIETISGIHTKKISEQIVHTDESTGAKTNYVQVEVENEAKNLSFDDSSGYFWYQKGRPAYYKNIRSGRVWVASDTRTTTDSRGTVHVYNTLKGPGANAHQNVDNEILKDSEKWEKMSPAEARDLWNAEYSKLSKTITTTHHVLTGALLPIWDRLEGDTRIYRMQTDDGERILGRVIQESVLESTLENLGVGIELKEYSGEQLANEILDNGAEATLVNGWIIKKSQVSGDERIELKGPDYYDMDLMRQMGVFSEVISYSTRYFIPTDRASEILDRIVKSKPVKVLKGAYAGPRLEGERPAFKKRTIPETTGNYPKKRLEKIIARRTRGWTNKPEIQVVEKQGELPQRVLDAIGPKDIVDAVLYQGKAYLVAENLGGPNHALTALFHESFGEYGLRLLESDPNIGPRYTLFENGLLQSHRAEIEKVAKEYDLDMGNERQASIAAKEFLSREAAKEAMASPIKKLIRLIQRWLSKIAPTFKTGRDDIRQWLRDARRIVETGDVGGAMAGEPAFQVTAWHGGPHKFDKFSMEKVGTGEGAQAFGYGLYFTDLEDVGRHYAKTGAGSGWIYDTTAGTKTHSELFRIAQDAAVDAGLVRKSSADTIAENVLNGIVETGSLNKYIKEYEIEQEGAYSKYYQAVVDSLKKLNPQKPNRNLYKVTLHKGKKPGEYTWLDWNDTVPFEVKKKIVDLLAAENLFDPDKRTKMLQTFFTGKAFYEDLSAKFAIQKELSMAEGEILRNPGNFGDKEASLFLLRAGIDGIRYPAGSLSGQKTDAKNYVVFDENAVTIDERIAFSKGKKSDTVSSMTSKEGPGSKDITTEKQPQQPEGGRRVSTGLSSLSDSELSGFGKPSDPVALNMLIEEAVLRLPNGTYLLNTVGKAAPSLRKSVSDMLGFDVDKQVLEKTVRGLSAQHPKAIDASLTLGLEEVRLSNQIITTPKTPESPKGGRYSEKFYKWFSDSRATKTGRPFDEPIEIGGYLIKSGRPISTEMPSKLEDALKFAKKFSEALNSFKEASNDSERLKMLSKTDKPLFDEYQDTKTFGGDNLLYDMEVKRLLVRHVLRYSDAPVPELKIGFRYSKPPANGFSYNFRDGVREDGVSIVGFLEPPQEGKLPKGWYYNTGTRDEHIIIGWDIGLKGSDGEPVLLYIQDLGPNSRKKVMHFEQALPNNEIRKLKAERLKYEKSKKELLVQWRAEKVQDRYPYWDVYDENGNKVGDGFRKEMDEIGSEEWAINEAYAQDRPYPTYETVFKKILPNPSRQAGEPGDIAFSKAKKDLEKDTLSVLETVSTIFGKPKKLIEGKKDLSYFKDLIASIPAFFKDKIPAVRSMFDATQERQDEYQEHILYMENHDDVNVGKIFKELPKDSYKKVGEYLVKTDQTQMGFRATFDKDLGFWVVKERGGNGNVYNVRNKSKEDGEAEAVEKTLEFEAKDLQKQGYTPEEVGAVMAFRMSTNKGFETLFSAMRELIKNAKEIGVKLPEIPVYRDGKSINISLNQAMAEMGDMRGFYFPRIRPRGRFVMTARKEGETPILETFNFRILNNPRVKELEKQGYEVTIAPSKQLGEDVFEMAGQLVKTQQVINAALDKLDTRKDSDTTKKGIEAISDEIQSIFATAIAEQVSNVIKERGSRVHMTQRSGSLYLGYEEDPQIAIAKYIRGLAGGEAKRNMVMKMLKAFTGTETSWSEFKKDNPDAEYSDYRNHVQEMMIDQREQPYAFKWGKAYIAETTRNPDFAENIVGVLRGAAVGKYLAFRVFSAPLVNLTALPTSTIASLKGAGISYGRAWRELGRGIQLYGKYRWDPKGMNANDKWIFDYMHQKGWDNAQFNSESLSVLRSTLGRGWDKIIDVGMFTFSESEKLNRAATIAAAFRGLSNLSENKGKTREEIAELAKQVSDNSHGIYNKGNYPYIALGGNPAAHIARMFYVFQRFSHTYLLNMKKLGFEQKDYVALAHMVVAPAVLAGAGASILAPIIGTILKAFGIDEPEEKVYETIGGIFGQSGETFARFGLAGLAGFSIKGSLALGVGAIPTSVKDILGAPGSVMSDIFLDGIPMIAEGNIEKGFEKIMPTGFGNIIRAYRESSEGLTTGKNRPVFYGNRPVKTEGYETLLRAISLYPARIAKIREIQYKGLLTEQKYTEKRADIYARIRKFYLSEEKNPEKWVEIMAEINAYNERALSAGPHIPLINAKSIRTNLKRSFKPSRRERLRDTNEEE